MRRHDRDALLGAAVQLALESGLGPVTFGAVARRADVPDRTVVYYFPTKVDLVAAVVEAVTGGLLGALTGVVGDARRPPAELLELLWPVLTAPQTRPVVQVWLEVAVRAGGGQPPYAAAGRALALGWLDWLAERVPGRTDDERRAAATRLLARVDGALLLHHLGLEDEARTSLSD